MRIVAMTICLFLINSAYSQTKEEDKVRFNAAIEWLESKLNYVYYDEVGEKWWTNTFYINDQKEVTIKHVSSKRPNTANIKNKTYTIRTFNLNQINPYSLMITDIKETSGRIVKGKMLELKTYDYRNQIHKRINNKNATSTSFLYLSFPEILNDSLSNYAAVVKEKFEEAIISSNHIYPKEVEVDKDFVFKILSGKYNSENDGPWKAQEVMLNVLRIEMDKSQILYFGFEPDNQRFYLTSLDSKGVKTDYLEVVQDSDISLRANGTVILKFHSLNAFDFMNESFFRN